MTQIVSTEIISGEMSISVPYWRETQRPFNNLIFLLPLLLFYEFGVMVAGGTSGHSIRNGADAWLRLWLQQAGMAIEWLPPILLLGSLMAWQWVTQQPWKTRWDTLGGMAAESFLYAFILILIGQLTDFWFRQTVVVRFDLSDVRFGSGWLLRMVTFMGAGIYEEFLFRLCLLPLAYAGFRLIMIPRRGAVAATVVTTSLVFSLAHYLGPSTDRQVLALLTDAVARVQSNSDLWFSFLFRTVAGMFFAGLYFSRGFGITVGAHAIYDVFVGVILIQEL